MAKGGGMGNMMKQVQQMQAKMEKMQAELEEIEIEASSGGGMVTVVCNGKQDVLSITLDPEVVDKEDIEMLQDLIVAAIKLAKEKAEEIQSSNMSQITGGMNLPGMNLHF